MSKPNDKPKVNAGTLKTAGRLLKYVTGPYKVQFIIVLICILMTSISSIAVSLSLRFLLDDFILPLVGQQNPNFTELYQAMAVLACIFILGVIARYGYPETDDQPVYPTGAHVQLYYCSNLYFHAAFKPHPDSPGSAGHPADDPCSQIRGRKQRKIFHQTADRPG